jgi:hypothetical protein
MREYFIGYPSTLLFQMLFSLVKWDYWVWGRKLLRQSVITSLYQWQRTSTWLGLTVADLNRQVKVAPASIFHLMGSIFPFPQFILWKWDKVKGLFYLSLLIFNFFPYLPLSTLYLLCWTACLKLKILLPQPLKCWDYRCAPPCLTKMPFFEANEHISLFSLLPSVRLWWYICNSARFIFHSPYSILASLDILVPFEIFAYAEVFSVKVLKYV